MILAQEIIAILFSHFYSQTSNWTHFNFFLGVVTIRTKLDTFSLQATERGQSMVDHNDRGGAI